MRGINDVILSVKRHVAIALGDEWEVRIPGEEEFAFERPFARVGRAGQTTIVQATNFRFSKNTQALVVSVFPRVKATAEDSLLEAGSVEDILYSAFWQRVDLGHPARIPLFDYDGIGTERGSQRRHPSDYLRVEDFSVSATQDATDAKLITVTADLRVAWLRQGAVPSQERTVERVSLEETVG